ncbi:hypothetical protein ES288_D09G112700v1 [Gossypium darwinii]|uniref:Uncharacterized protein n=1 Tax=Gossypium darwinii TaxID=34276 RepID=A0A5D2BAA8_GOSDA|nr:hypothetical protein ES288_D09G112700v1 [Gossypium darwinii]
MFQRPKTLLCVAQNQPLLDVIKPPLSPFSSTRGSACLFHFPSHFFFFYCQLLLMFLQPIYYCFHPLKVIPIAAKNPSLCRS